MTQSAFSLPDQILLSLRFAIAHENVGSPEVFDRDAEAFGINGAIALRYSTSESNPRMGALAPILQSPENG